MRIDPGKEYVQWRSGSHWRRHRRSHGGKGISVRSRPTTVGRGVEWPNGRYHDQQGERESTGPEQWALPVSTIGSKEFIIEGWIVGWFGDPVESVVSALEDECDTVV